MGNEMSTIYTHEKVNEYFSNDSNISEPENWKNIDCLIEAAIQQITLHPVTLEIIKNPEYTDEVDVDDVIDGAELSEKDAKWCKEHNNLNSVVLENLFGIVVITNCTGNDDSRGGGCGDVNFKKEDFIWHQQVNGNLTLFDLASIVYRMKGSKYDYWYELYSFTEAKMIDDTLVLNVKFSYGS